MSKVLKIGAAVVGTVASIALIATGVGAPIGAGLLGITWGTMAAAAGALSLAASLLAGKPKVPSEARNRLFASLDPDTPRKLVLGRTAMATDIAYQAYTGTNQEYLHWIMVNAAHEVEGQEELWFDSEMAWSQAGGVTTKYAGYLQVTRRTVGTANNGIGIDSIWTTACTLTGCAYLHVRFKLTGNSKKAESPFAQSVPNRVTVRGKGAKVPDPRLSTSAGGSGSQSMTDQTTWAFTTAAESGRNPALLLLFYLLGWRINGKLSVGRGIPAARIDFASFIAAANMCDETVALAAGGTERRYRAAGVFSESEDPGTVTGNLLNAMSAVLRDDGGRIALHVLHNDLADPDALTFTVDDILGDESWRQTASIEQTFNIVRGRYTDPSDAALYQLADSPEVELASFDGIDRIDSFDLAAVESASQWQRLAKQRLQRAQYQGVYSATFNARAWGTSVGRIVKLTHAGLGWSQKLFRVTGQGIRTDGTVPLVLQEEHASIYAWAADEKAPVAAAVPTVYDPTLSAIVAAIGDAAVAADLGDLATLDKVQLGSGGQVLRENGAAVTDASAITALGTAAAIVGQGGFATKNVADYGSDLVSVPLAVQLGNMPGGKLDLGLAVYSTGQSGASLKPDEAGANKTETRTAAAISGQGALATANAVDLATAQVVNKSLANLDPSASTKLGGVEAGATVGGRLGVNVLREVSQGGGLIVSADVITSEGTAADFAGRGALARRDDVYLDSGFVKESLGGSNVTTAGYKTALGTAAAISNQAAIATDAAAKPKLDAIEAQATRNGPERAVNRNSSFADTAAGQFPQGWRIGRDGRNGGAAVASDAFAERGSKVAVLSPFTILDSEDFAVSPGETVHVPYRFRTSANRTNGTAPNWIIAIEWGTEAGFTGALAGTYHLGGVPITAAAGAQQGMFTATAPAGARVGRMMIAFDAVSPPGGGQGQVDYGEVHRDEPGADVTATNAPAISGPSTQTINADYTGAALGGQLPRVLQFNRTKGGTNVNSSTTWSYVASNCTITNNGNGNVSVTAVSGKTAKVTATSLRDGVSLPWETPILRNDGDPPAQTGGGAGATSFGPVNVDGNVNETAYDASPIVLATGQMAANASGQARLVISGTYFAPIGSTRTVSGKWQRSPDNVTWTDAGVSATGSQAFGGSSYEAGDAFEGAISTNAFATGMTAGATYHFRFIAIVSAGSGTYVTGTASGAQS